jgi:ring-1,2-phenylacetyl-CoA epoxidase subunit PaaC
MSDGPGSVLLALADDELVIGHRHSEWTGFAPHLEEDVAFSSIAQDEIGHAAALYAIAADETGQSPDRLAFGRAAEDFRHAILCERPNRDWAYTLARHWLYDTADDLRLETLERSTHRDLRALAHKMRREERYHLIHAEAWMKRVSHGPMEGRVKIIDALSEAFGEALGLFEPFESEGEALAAGWLAAPSAELLDRFNERAERALDSWDLPITVRGALDVSAEFVASSSGDLISHAEADEGFEAAPATGALGGRRGQRSADFGPLWSDLTATSSMSPEATW